MKRKLALLLSLVMVLTVFVACANQDEQPAEEPAETEVTEEVVETDEETADAGEIAQVGLGVVAHTERSKDAEGDHLASARADVTGAAVAFDNDGKIVKIQIDNTIPTVEFENDEAIIEDNYQTKRELGDEYGMRKASEIEKEWYEQADHIENYLLGKTIDEVKAIELNEENVAVDEDILTGATISIDDMILAVEKAWDNKADVEGVTRIGLGMKITPGARSEGQVTLNTTVGVVGLGETDEILYAYTDGVQPKVEVEDGKIVETVDYVKSKHELGDEYDMRKASEIEKEWFEQNTAWMEYIVGKTIEEVNSLEYTERDERHQFVPAEVDIMSEVTITVEDYNAVIENAIDNAE